MAQRGRKSAASLAIAPTVPIALEQRLAPPVHLSDAERAAWLELVNDQPAGAFSATHAPLLEMYCRHVVNARTLADELLNFERAWLARDDGLKRYDRLLAMSERESRAASSLATRLRITRQAVEHPTTAGRAIANQKKAGKPWELPT
ncbi:MULTISPECIES: hypothetical protein [unclassified Caballeronia]|uniref:hypothetical protein n=2 Tax=Caballeronia TaxID=1827195 RepID=UPI002857A9D7|nr:MULTISPECIES: hypothetical protein [unclassified Caballeronia]MDR5777790.1 hypothetical protein [Caballeronia sp. LZ002]MDR5853212.1 hypothetical protein [Caballeronia sp. LZ003]